MALWTSWFGKLRDERGIRIPVVTPLAFRTPSLVKELFPDGGQGHGGAMMTALQLHLNPQNCRMDLACEGKLHEWNGLKVIDLTKVEFQGAPVGVYFNYDEITDPTGVVGDGREATAEKGKVLFETMVEGCAAFVEWSKGISVEGVTGESAKSARVGWGLFPQELQVEEESFIRLPSCLGRGVRDRRAHSCGQTDRIGSAGGTYR